MASGPRGQRIKLSEDERHRRSVSTRIRNAWTKEGKPGGKEELARRQADPEVVLPLYRAQGWTPPELPEPGKKKPKRPAGSPKKGPPQPPPPKKKPAQKPAPKAPPAPPAPPKKPSSKDSGAFGVLFPELD